jgi:hypothetical protein
VVPVSQRALSYVLAGGCAAWAALAFARTDRVAGAIGAPASEVRALAVRDVGNGITLALASDPRPAIAARVLFDLSDAVRYGRGRPAMAAGIVAFAALGVAALVAPRR